MNRPVKGIKKMKMKKYTKQTVVVMLFVTFFFGCGPTTEDILKKYDIYGELQIEAGKAHVYLETMGSTMMIRYSMPLLHSNETYIETLSERWFIADAANPSVKLPVKMAVTTINSTENDVTQPTIYGHNFTTESMKERFLLIGFEGIHSNESDVAEISPLFFLVENDKSAPAILTDAPRKADGLFTANYVQTRFVEYSTLTVKKFNMRVSAWLDLSLQSISLTDEKGVEIIVPDLDKWFENAKTKGDMRINGDISVSFNTTGVNNVNLNDNAEMVFDFEIGEKLYAVILSVGSELYTEKTASGKYILLPEETATLSTKKIITEK